MKSAIDTSGADRWWRHRMVWLVIAGPLVVVVAGIATAIIAVRGADPVINTDPRSGFAEKPAVAGRNHAASPAPGR